MMPSFGPGSPVLGGASGLARSIIDGSPSLNQQSPSSVGFVPGLQVPAPPDATGDGNVVGDMSPELRKLVQAGQQPQQPQAQAGGQITLPVQDQSKAPGVQVPVSEAQTIIKALTNRLAHQSKMEQLGAGQPVGV